MRKVSHFQGLNIHQRREQIFINEESYRCNLLGCFGMTNCSNMKVPLSLGTRLIPSLDKLVVDLKTYQSMIGLLLYLTASQPHIMFSVCNCARYLANPRDLFSLSLRIFFATFIEIQFLDYGIQRTHDSLFNHILMLIGLSIGSQKHYMQMSILRWKACELEV